LFRAIARRTVYSIIIMTNNQRTITDPKILANHHILSSNKKNMTKNFQLDCGV
jgi:hypothetical protein